MAKPGPVREATCHGDRTIVARKILRQNNQVKQDAPRRAVVVGEKLRSVAEPVAERAVTFGIAQLLSSSPSGNYPPSPPSSDG